MFYFLRIDSRESIRMKLRNVGVRIAGSLRPGKENSHRGRHDSDSLCVVSSLRAINLLRVVSLVLPGPLGSERGKPEVTVLM